MLSADHEQMPPRPPLPGRCPAAKGQVKGLIRVFCQVSELCRIGLLIRWLRVRGWTETITWDTGPRRYEVFAASWDDAPVMVGTPEAPAAIHMYNTTSAQSGYATGYPVGVETVLGGGVGVPGASHRRIVDRLDPVLEHPHRNLHGRLRGSRGPVGAIGIGARWLGIWPEVPPPRPRSCCCRGSWMMSIVRWGVRVTTMPTRIVAKASPTVSGKKRPFRACTVQQQPLMNARWC